MTYDQKFSRLQPDPDRAQLDRPLPPDPEHDCILLGPPGAGKSSFLAGLGRACDGNLRGDVALSGVRGPSLASLTGQAAQFLGGDSQALAPTEEPTTHDFQLRIRASIHKGGETRTLQVIFQDVPGQDLFETPDLPAVQHWLQRGRTASCLVLCVHALKPNRLLWESRLPLILDALLSGSGRLAPRLSRVGDGELPPMWSPVRQLPFQRVLVLLTQVDRLCATVARAVRANKAGVGAVPPALNRLLQNPVKFALHLEPLQMVKDRLGEGLLKQIRSACNPGTRLAVGLTSAWGFEPLGSGAGGDPTGFSRFNGWTPFGLWESMLFLATGEARHPVEILPVDDESPRYSHAYSSVRPG